MATGLISIRTARPDDSPDIARVHREAWRYAYQGLIPHLPLERMIARRGAGWWQRSLESGMHALGRCHIKYFCTHKLNPKPL